MRVAESFQKDLEITQFVRWHLHSDEDVLVSGLREYLAELQVSLPVSRLAKWKTTGQLVATGFLLAGEAGEQVLPYTTQIGLVLLWISALVTLYTGWDYFRAGVRHLNEN